MEFGPFSQVWDDLGSLDDQICRMGSAQCQHMSFDACSREDSEQSSSNSEAENWMLKANVDCSAAKMSEFAEIEKPAPWVKYRGSHAATGRFSQVWDQLNTLDSNLNLAHGVPGSNEAAQATHTLRLTDDISLTVVTLAGRFVGKYTVTAGMTVSTLRDKIALSCGELPFMLTLVYGTQILEDALELDDFVTSDDPVTLTLLHAAPASVGRGAFSDVWDSLSHLDARLLDLRETAS